MRETAVRSKAEPALRRIRSRVQQNDSRSPYSNLSRTKRSTQRKRIVRCDRNEEMITELELDPIKEKKGFLDSIMEYIPFFGNSVQEKYKSTDDNEPEECDSNDIIADARVSHDADSSQETSCMHKEMKSPAPKITQTQTTSDSEKPISNQKSNDSKHFVFDRNLKRRREEGILNAHRAMEENNTITWEEYEEYSHHLRSLVKVNASESKNLLDDTAKNMNREISASVLHEYPKTRAITGYSIGGRPRGSRLLTEMKRDAASRNAYSAAIAEKVLSCMKKLQNPQKRMKLTPLPTSSWADCQLLLAKNQKEEALRNAIKDKDEEDIPTKSLPVSVPCPDSSLTSPGKSDIAQLDCGSQAAECPAISAEAEEYNGHYTFTEPVPCMHVLGNDEANASIQFFFPPPPADRLPPIRAPKQKSVPLSSQGSRLLSFSPPSTEKKPANPQAQEASSLDSQSSSHVQSKEPLLKTAKKDKAEILSTNSTANPLAKFMTAAPGSWKCPSCAVSNTATCVKCPCCSTDKPTASYVDKDSTGANPAADSVTTVSTVNGTLSSISDKNLLQSSLTSSFAFGKKVSDPQHNEVVKKVEAPSQPAYTFGFPKSTYEPSTQEPSDPALTSKTKPFTFGSALAPASTVPEPASSSFVPNEPAIKAQPAAPQPLFTFGKQIPDTSPSDQPAKVEVLKDSSTQGFKITRPQQSAFAVSVGEKTTDTAAPIQPAFTFSATSFDGNALSKKSKKRAIEEENDGQSKRSQLSSSNNKANEGFVFGSAKPSEITALDSTREIETKNAFTENSKPAFVFGQSNMQKTESESTKPQSQPAFVFGQKTRQNTESDTKPIVDATPSAAPQGQPTFGNTTPGFGFNASPFAAFSSDSASAPQNPNSSFFSFSAPATFETESASAQSSKSTPFVFGSSNPSKSAMGSSTPIFGSPSFNATETAPSAQTSTVVQPTAKPFDATSRMDDVNNGAPTRADTGFTSPFAQNTSAQNVPSAFGFQAANNNVAKPNDFAKAPAFGQSSNTTTFGVTPEKAASFAASGTATAFGSSLQTPSTVVGAFGSSNGIGNNAAFGGMQAPSTQSVSFGAPTATTSNAAPAFGAFNAAPMNNNAGFGAPSASAFGFNGSSVTAPVFGATAQPQTAFGANTNTFSAPSNAFANSAATAAPMDPRASFGNSASFSQPGASFTGPANTFGNPPANAFSIGSAPAPQQRSGRRILRARTRHNKR